MSLRLTVIPLAAALCLGSAAGGQGPIRPPVCGTEELGSGRFLVLHRYWAETGAVGTQAGRAWSGPADRDLDHVAILEDRGDLVARRNPFDLDRAALRLTPNLQGGFDLARLDLTPEPPGSPLAVPDDGEVAVGLPFPFPFYGRTWRAVHVQADGSLTFGTPDAGGGERGMARFLGGPPRIAPFYADLDPARGGSITVRVSSDRALFLWAGVPGAGQINRNTFQAALLPGGEIDLVWSAEMQTREAIVGVSPGATSDLTPADLSSAAPAGSAGALAERFSETERLDLVSVTRRFLAGRPDVFDQVIVYTTRPLNPLGGSLAFAVNVRNAVRGIGLDPHDDSAAWGSAGRLESVVFMDSIDQYLAVDGFEILGHEVGHRWLARLRVRDGAGGGLLLGRGGVHWSFFLDTDASVMEGNDIADLGGGRFETVDIARRYSPLDQYVMGLRGPGEVPPFFYVEAADDFRPNRAYKFSTQPEAGVSFTGLRRDLSIEDVIAAMGPRVPDHTRADRVIRQAYVLVADATAAATPERTAALARIRRGFEDFYRQATDGRGSAETTLP